MIATLCLLFATLIPGEPLPILGEGFHRYAWTPQWPAWSDEAPRGATHGDIAIDSAGLIYLTCETAPSIRVHRDDGDLVRVLGDDLGAGLHGLDIAWDNGREVLYAVHTARAEILKMTLDGEVLWSRGPAAESSSTPFRPTGVVVAPGGRVYVADGYGPSLIFELNGEDGSLVRVFGGIGTDPGRFRVCHGLCVDHRTTPPTLVVADRENGRLQRMSLDGDFLEVIADGILQRPGKVVQRGDYLLVPDLGGRVTILDEAGDLVCHLGDNPDPKLRGTDQVDREAWTDGLFLSPHSAMWDAAGNLYVMDWNRHGRITRLARVYE